METSSFVLAQFFSSNRDTVEAMPRVVSLVLGIFISAGPSTLTILGTAEFGEESGMKYHTANRDGK